MSNPFCVARWRRPVATAVGALALTLSGTTVALAQCTLNGSANPCSLTGPITVSSGYLGPPGTVSTASGVITNNSTIQINAGSGNNTFLNLGADTTLQGSGGILTLNSGDDNGYAVLESFSGFTLANATNTIQGYGIIGNSGLSVINGAGGTVLANVSGQTLLINATGGLTNNGTMQADAGATLQVNSNLTNSVVDGGPGLDGGTYVMNNGIIQLSTLGTSGGEILYNAGTIVLNGPSARMTDAANNNALSGIFLNGTGSSFTVEGGNHFSTSPANSGSFLQYGFLVVGAGSTLSTTQMVQNGAGNQCITQVDGQLNAAVLLNAAGTVLSGTGVVNGSVTNSGSMVTPGDNGAPGTLTINGLYDVPSSTGGLAASLNILVGSAASATLNVNSASLSQTITFTSYGGFSPPAGATYDFLNYTNGLTGTFTTVDVSALNLAPGLTASLDYSHPGEVLLHIVQTSAGLTLSATGSGIVTANPISLTGTYAIGTKVCLTATPSAGWRFVSWSGAALDSNNCLVLNSNASVTANFTQASQIHNNRSFVSTAGNDADICGITAPCRSLSAALAVTTAGGEIVVLNPGEYDPATITQPVTISAIGIDASITATSGNALTINTTGDVTLTGLGLHGLGTGNDGVLVQQAGILRLYNVTAENFANDGVEFTSAGDLAIYNSRFTDNQYGLAVENASTQAFVHNASFDHNSLAGVYAPMGVAVVGDSSGHFNGSGFESNGGTLVLAENQAVLNNTGVSAIGASVVLQFSSCSVALNTLYSYSAASGAQISGTGPGTSLANGPASGTLATPTGLQ
jgi:hypothetical protein